MIGEAHSAFWRLMMWGARVHLRDKLLKGQELSVDFLAVPNGRIGHNSCTYGR